MERLPHSPEFPDLKETPEYRLAYKQNMDDWREATKQTALMAWKNSPEYTNIDKYQRYIQSDQWPDARAKYKSRFVDNKIDLARREALALLTDCKPTMEVSSNVDAYIENANIIEGVIKAEWSRQSMADDFVTMADIGRLYGTGYWRLGAAWPGKMRVQALTPTQVIPINPSSTIQDASAVCCLTFKPVAYFKRVWPLTSVGIENQAKLFNRSSNDKYIRPPAIPESVWNVMQPGFKKALGTLAPDQSAISSAMYGMIPLEEYFVDDFSINESMRNITVCDPYLSLDQHNWWYVVKPGQRLYPRKRLIVYGGDMLLYDGPASFWHGMYPFVEFRPNPVPWNYYGLSSYRPLLPIQDAINDVPAGILDMCKRALNPVIIAKSNAVSDAAWKEFVADRPGAQLKVNPNINIANDIKYADIPQVPNFIPQILMGFLLPEFDKQSGLLDISTLSGKKQIPAGETMDQMKDSLQTSLRREERFLETFLERAGQQAVSNVTQYYTKEQRLKLLGENGITSQDFYFDPAEMWKGFDSESHRDAEVKATFWRNFALRIKPGSLHSGAKDREKQEAIALAARGLLPVQELYKVLGKDPEEAQRLALQLAQEMQIKAGVTSSQQARPPRSNSEKENGTAPIG